MRPVLLLALLLAVGACRPDLPDGVDPEAQKAWERYRASPDAAAFEHFIAKNRLAAQAHGHPYDALGALYQVRSLEAQSEQALRADDAALAQSVTQRVDDIEEGGLLVVLEEVLPGSTDRLLEARARLAAHFE